jgi:hypothetical protein
VQPLMWDPIILVNFFRVNVTADLHFPGSTFTKTSPNHQGEPKIFHNYQVSGSNIDLSPECQNNSFYPASPDVIEFHPRTI